MEIGLGRVKGPPPEYSDAVHCLLLAQLDRDGGCTHLAYSKELLTLLGPDMLVQLCYPISGSQYNAQGLYSQVAEQLDALVAYYGPDLNIEELL